MDPAAARERLTSSAVAHLATVTAGGRPHVVPCCFAVTGSRIYTAVDGKPKSGRTLRRIENLQANGRYALMVDRYADDWSKLWWVRVEGHGWIVEEDAEEYAAKGLLAERYPQYAEVGMPGPVLALEIESWTSWP